MEKTEALEALSAHVAHIQEVTAQLEAEKVKLTAEAIDAGAKWAEIGPAVGLSLKGAHWILSDKVRALRAEGAK